MLKLLRSGTEDSCVSILGAVKEKVGNMQEQMGRASRERSLKKEAKGDERNQKHCDMKCTLGGLISRLNMPKERIHELEEWSVELSELKCRERE